MDIGWFTEKVDFTDVSVALPAEETCATLCPTVGLESVFPDTTEVLECFDTSATENTIKEYCPTSPEQKVPDALMSPATSVLSPGPAFSVDSGVFSPNRLDVYSEPSSPYYAKDTKLPCVQQLTAATTVIQPSETIVKSPRTPYSRDKQQSYNVKPKVKSPQQKERKRVQNKDAATRYRVKKRDEQDVLFVEVEKLEQTNTELKEQVSSLSKEMEYLKNLLLEVYKVKLQKQAI